MGVGGEGGEAQLSAEGGVFEADDQPPFDTAFHPATWAHEL